MRHTLEQQQTVYIRLYHHTLSSLCLFVHREDTCLFEEGRKTNHGRIDDMTEFMFEFFLEK